MQLGWEVAFPVPTMAFSKRSQPKNFWIPESTVSAQSVMHIIEGFSKVEMVQNDGE